MRIAVLNGPNLNLLGTREPALYGTTTLSELEARLRAVSAELGIELLCAQHNGEGDLISEIQGLAGRVDGVLINAGAYSHTSLAIRDAFASVSIPYVEVHLTNIYAREPERRTSVLASGARAVICGFGVEGYEWALRGIVKLLAIRE